MNSRRRCRASVWARISTLLGGDREGAIRLYAWNTAVSAAFYGPLQGLEVALRNAMHRRLAERYGEAWYDNRDAGLDRGAMQRVASARTELARDAYGDDPPRIVAALSFGFWVSLLGPGGRIGAGPWSGTAPRFRRCWARNASIRTPMREPAPRAAEPENNSVAACEPDGPAPHDNRKRTGSQLPCVPCPCIPKEPRRYNSHRQ